MFASEISAICQIPVFYRERSCWHGPRIRSINNRNANAARFLTRLSSSVAARFSGKVLSPCTSTELLAARDDEYDGVVIEASSLPSTANVFASQLRASLAYWRSKGKKGIWLKLFEEQADLVPIAIQEGFEYHHAEGGYVMLTHWIPSEPCLLPCGPSHQIGIAAFVINHHNQVLAVKEKCSCSCSGVWKLPTGFIDKSEELFSGAVREVKEETGIDTEFLELVAFRHVHRVAFDKSDLLFVCMLNPLSLEIQIDENEIQEAKWISVDEVLRQQFYKEDGMLKRVMEICMATHEKNYSGFVAHQLISKFDGKMSHLYYKDVPI
ncbi:nudix hydrolase-like protein 8 [Perilla frutescens var. frutescens]|nr:nudix hydrolase-like protein 8 [Perilla frutescens var. frutescens]